MSIRLTRRQWLDSNKKPEDSRSPEERKASKNNNPTTQARKAPRQVRFRELVQAVEQQWDGHEVIKDPRMLEAVARRRALRHAQNERLMAVYDWIEQHRSNKGESE
jgi:hypothetical protein